MTNWNIILAVAIILIFADKALTVMNIKAVEKNYPNADHLSIEKNPIAKFFFQKSGLFWGSIFFGIFSLATFFIAMYLLTFATRFYSPTNYWGISFYIMCIFYSFVIMNNFYFLLRYSKLI
jgi:hypothetical protein